FFASSAVYPISIMPDWLKVVAHVNPLTYQVDALRELMLSNSDLSLSSIAVDFGVLTFTTILLIAIAARLYPRLAQ
ncbi:MAG TPA: ABC transporter permease, partial [Candidatus Limnocylindrales bacterium]